MSKKNFKIARKPGQENGAQTQSVSASESKTRMHKAAPAVPTVSSTTRKTIEVPEDYFFRVKMRALERKMLEKELWSEILVEYFKNHPVV